MVGIGLYTGMDISHKTFPLPANRLLFTTSKLYPERCTPVRNENGKWITVKVAFPGRDVFVRVWKVEVGEPTFTSDTDFEDNQPLDRTITTTFTVAT